MADQKIIEVSESRKKITHHFPEDCSKNQLFVRMADDLPIHFHNQHSLDIRLEWCGARAEVQQLAKFGEAGHVFFEAD